MFNYERDALLGMKTVDLVHLSEREDARQMLKSLVQDKQKNYQKLRRFIRSDCSTMHALIYVTVNRRENGKPVSFVAVLTDLSEQVKLEEQVRQAEKMQAIGRLAGGVAHDFNNLLTVILGAGNLIAKDASLPRPAKEHAEAIVDAGRRGAELTQQLLTYSRQQSPLKRLLDINESIRDAQLMLHRIVGECVKIRVHLDSDPLLVHINPIQFQQVLMNLVINARDAMLDAGEIEIKTKLQVEYTWSTSNHRNAAKTGAVEVAVSDNGSGITPEVLKRIYDPFFTTKEVGRGTGLGMSVVHGIVEESGGTIEVETVVGTGTTMRVLFPMAS
jgi:PAS domain S-box-containing protein